MRRAEYSDKQMVGKKGGKRVEHLVERMVARMVLPKVDVMETMTAVRRAKQLVV